MLTAYLKRGVKAGVVAGVVFGLFVALIANPLVGFTDELGHGNDHTSHDHATGDHPDSAVSTAITNGASVVAGVLWGILLGGVVFGVVYYFLEPAIPGTESTKSYLLAVAGFVTVSGAPWLVLPPQLPGVDEALPTETRLLLYGGMMIVGGLVSAVAGVVYGRLRETHTRATAAVVAVLPFSVLTIPAVLSPAPPVEGTLPPELATGLTGMVVFGQALLWLLLAGTHAQLHRRSVDTEASEIAAARTDGRLTAD
ncbi:MAG: CbtA family protein [Haloplanus sp.]